MERDGISAGCDWRGPMDMGRWPVGVHATSRGGVANVNSLSQNQPYLIFAGESSLDNELSQILGQF